MMFSCRYCGVALGGSNTSRLFNDPGLVYKLWNLDETGESGDEGTRPVSDSAEATPQVPKNKRLPTNAAAFDGRALLAEPFYDGKQCTRSHISPVEISRPRLESVGGVDT
jgi:hypothetical protein